MSSPKLTINHLPDELLIEIFDSYRHSNNVQSHQWCHQSEWFKFIHVCKRWRAVMFASASRLDLRLVLNRKKGGHMDTMSHLPSLPIDIDYSSRRFDPRTKKDVDNMTMSMAAALIRPDRIRQITLEGPIEDLRILFRATEGPLPALESLKIRHESGLYGVDVEISDTFLEGPNLQLRTLSLHNITLPSISRLLSSVSALTSLDLEFCIGDGQAISQLPHLQDVPSLRHLGLKVVSRTSHTTQPTKTQKRFILPKLTSFRYEGHSSFLNTLVAGFTAPSLRDVDIKLRYTDDINPPHSSPLPVNRRCRGTLSLCSNHHFEILFPPLVARPLGIRRPPPAEFQTGYDTYPQYDGADEQPVFCNARHRGRTDHTCR